MSHDKIMELLQGEIDAADLDLVGRVDSLKLIQQHMQYMAKKLDEYSNEFCELNKKYYKLRVAVEEGLK